MGNLPSKYIMYLNYIYNSLSAPLWGVYLGEGGGPDAQHAAEILSICFS